MSNKNLTIDLKNRLDKDGNKYFIGKLSFPGNIDCSKGVVFLVFVSDTGQEQLQVASMDKNGFEQ